MESVLVTAADFNGSTFDGPPFDFSPATEMPAWLFEAGSDGRIECKGDDRDYAAWDVKTSSGIVRAEPGDHICCDERGELSVEKAV